MTWSFDLSTSFDEVNAVIGAIDYRNDMLVRYQASLGLLKSHYTKMPLESDLDDQIRVFIFSERVSEKMVNSITLSRLDCR